jgi:hypothetical protein
MTNPFALKFTNIQSKIFRLYCQHSGTYGINDEPAPMRKGFLLIELAFALMLMSIVVMVTLRLVDDIAHMYGDIGEQTRMLATLSSAVEGGVDRRDSSDKRYRVDVTHLPHQLTAQTATSFLSWVMQNVNASQIKVQAMSTEQSSCETIAIDYDR